MDEKKDLSFFRDEVRKVLLPVCSVNKVCDGNPDRVCQGQKYGKAIGFGGAGQGRTFDANYKALAEYRLKMRIVKKHAEPQMEKEWLGKTIKIPVLVPSISGVKINMNDIIPEIEFQKRLLLGARRFGTIGLSGNTPHFPDHPGVDVIKENDTWGIPIFKPQAQKKLKDLFARAESAGALAVGVDLDGCGSTNWERIDKPVYRKSPEELKELVSFTKLPVIFKGIMSLEDADLVYTSGAQAIAVSNHGGRVLDHSQGVAEVLPEIAAKYKGKITLIADGAVRTGFDVLKILALGADMAMIGRPLARMALAGGEEAVAMYLEYVAKEFRSAMLMTGCDNLDEINNDILVDK